jgi:hypothetical protein
MTAHENGWVLNGNSNTWKLKYIAKHHYIGSKFFIEKTPAFAQATC